MSALRYLRRHLVSTAVVSVAVAGLAVGVTVLLTGGQSTHSPVGTRAAGAQQAGSVTKGSAWLAGKPAGIRSATRSAGAQSLTRMTTDLARVAAAERAGKLAAARAAGARLAADAGAALSGTMPPVDAAVYRSALEQLRVAGSQAAAGRFGPGVARMLLAGETGLMKVTAAADMPVAAKTPLIPEGSSRRS